MEEEIKSLQEANKALSLYINTIVSRLLSHKGFERVLAKDPRDAERLPSPQSPTLHWTLDLEPGKGNKTPSFLQRTKSVLTRKPLPIAEEVASPTRAPAMAVPTRQPAAQLREDGRQEGYSPRPLSGLTYPSMSRRAVSPARTSSNPEDTKLTLQIRKSPSIIPSKNNVTDSKGLRPISLIAAADEVTPAEARRLSAQFRPIDMVEDSSGTRELVVGDPKNRRGSWMTWITGEKESGGSAS